MSILLIFLFVLILEIEEFNSNEKELSPHTHTLTLLSYKMSREPVGMSILLISQDPSLFKSYLSDLACLSADRSVNSTKRSINCS